MQDSIDWILQIGTGALGIAVFLNSAMRPEYYGNTIVILKWFHADVILSIVINLQLCYQLFLLHE